MIIEFGDAIEVPTDRTRRGGRDPLKQRGASQRCLRSAVAPAVTFFPVAGIAGPLLGTSSAGFVGLIRLGQFYESVIYRRGFFPAPTLGPGNTLGFRFILRTLDVTRRVDKFIGRALYRHC